MYTNIEFLGTEPIENVITSMHYKMDKIIFFGYKEVIEEYRMQTENFLKKYCGVKDVIFHEVSEKDLSSILAKMTEVVEKERVQGNQLFFDVTGGESLILVAFGMLSKEYALPMHLYNVEEDKLIVLNTDIVKSIQQQAEQQKVLLNLERYIEMRGAKINHSMDKDGVDANDAEFMVYVDALWQIMKKYKDEWNRYSIVLQNHFKPSHMYASATLGKDDTKDLYNFKSFLEDLANAGVLVDFRSEEMLSEREKKMKFSFYYKSMVLKDCLWKGGTILELHVCEEMKKVSTDCNESVHLDWDGQIHTMRGVDVLNEIDVLCIKGNIPTFISCKSGRMDGGQALQPMYELETVTRQFGGKYAKKVLATLQSVEGVYAERAKEMGIELKCY